ncbi:MAG TPA: protein-disulfide reductase DsbD domain-containing protein [Terriglobales bacterium]|nr:protein-disulfide reductase DsbD domain-containing protein [Terriglobales bacterium]
MEFRTRSLQMIAPMLLLCIAPAAPQSSKSQHAHISLIAAPSDHSGTQWIGLRFQLDPGWHIYWTNPGDSGEPPKITWHLPSGFQAGDLQFPAPHRIADHGLTDYGYESEAVLLSKLTVPAGETSNKPEIAADIRYLVCREVCIPAKDHVSLNLREQNAGNASQLQAAQARLPQSLPRGVHARAIAGVQAFLLSVGPTPQLGQITDFIPSDAQVIDNSAKPQITKSGVATQVRLKKSEQLDHPVGELNGLLITNGQSYNVVVPVTATKSSRKPSSPKHN